MLISTTYRYRSQYYKLNQNKIEFSETVMKTKNKGKDKLYIDYKFLQKYN